MATAQGKVVLLGEHAVVYGVPAIAAGVDRGAVAQAEPAQTSLLTIGDRQVTNDGEDDLSRAFFVLLRALEAPALSVRVSSNLPLGSGLGASAAIGVAVARAVQEYAPASAQGEARVLEAADAWERVFHGNPSGLDVRAAALGGCLWFSKESGASPIALASPLELCIGLAGPPVSTRQMVESVARLKERRPDTVERTLDAILALVKNAKLCLEAGDLVGLGKLMDLNQMLLAGLFVSTSDIERACEIARAAGALGAKLTGAGGGGAVVALAGENPGAIVLAWQAAGIEGFSCRVADASGPTP